MEKIKFILLSVIIIGILGILGYWAVMTLEPGDVHFYKAKQLELAEKNEAMAEELEKLKSELASLEPETEETTTTPEDPKAETPPKPTPPASSSANQTLINELEKLITDNVFMKVGSQGTRVGTVQKFLNIYNKTTNKIDNDYGPGMKTAVTNFQKAVGVTADGETGPSTYRKMIDWLKKQ